MIILVHNMILNPQAFLVFAELQISIWNLSFKISKYQSKDR